MQFTKPVGVHDNSIHAVNSWGLLSCSCMRSCHADYQNPQMSVATDRSCRSMPKSEWKIRKWFSLWNKRREMKKKTGIVINAVDKLIVRNAFTVYKATISVNTWTKRGLNCELNSLKFWECLASRTTSLWKFSFI